MEPKKCPFCDSDCVDVILQKAFFDSNMIAYVVCSCGAKGPTANLDEVDPEQIETYDSDEIEDYMNERAIIFWNRRC